jgi:hypothetical protein
MANRERGEVDGTLGGRQFTFVVDMSAMCEIETLLSTPERDFSYRMDLLPQIGRLRSIAIRAFFWGATRRHHKAVGIEEIGALIDDEEGGVLHLLGLVRQIAGLAEPDKADKDAISTGKGKRPRTGQAGAGGTSSSKPSGSA